MSECRIEALAILAVKNREEKRREKMSKKVYLMRHAKSSWKEPLPDHERPLNKRGKRAAKAIGQALSARGVLPDEVLASDAKRARSTARRLLKAMGLDKGRLKLLPSLYEANAQEILELLRTQENEKETILLIGHNPAISDAAVLLSGDRRFDWLPTGAVVGLEFPVKKWRELGEGKGEVVLTLFPRELE
jgi:phosphohistidine phosphatase